MMEQAGSKQRGFSLVELMIVVVVIAILASIALPSYQDYVKKSRARAATADLMALSVAVENYFQRELKYPDDLRKVTTWKDADSDFFTYNLSPNNTYPLTATGVGAMAGCVLKLQHDNTRTVSSASDCGISSW